MNDEEWLHSYYSCSEYLQECRQIQIDKAKSLENMRSLGIDNQQLK